MTKTKNLIERVVEGEDPRVVINEEKMTKKSLAKMIKDLNTNDRGNYKDNIAVVEDGFRELGLDPDKISHVAAKSWGGGAYRWLNFVNWADVAYPTYHPLP